MQTPITTPHATIFFGNRTAMIEPDQWRGKRLSPVITGAPHGHIIFQNQVHKADGLAITHENSATQRTQLIHNSDYLITNIAQQGIGVLTADCLPIALIDPINHASGIIHAGWRGTIAHIIENTIMHMQTRYGTRPTDLHAWLGPCAHPCCYHVDEAFIQQLPAWACAAVTAQKTFDLPACALHALNACNVPKHQIITHHSRCTICNTNFLSYRRNPSLTARQPSIIWLN